jgi:hypothetical protein
MKIWRAVSQYRLMIILINFILGLAVFIMSIFPWSNFYLMEIEAMMPFGVA